MSDSETLSASARKVLMLNPKVMRGILAANIRQDFTTLNFVRNLHHEYLSMVLHAENLQKRYDRQCVFERLSFEVRSGESLAIQGANGSGKSTLMRLLAGVAVPTQGQVTYTQNGKRLEKTNKSVTLALLRRMCNSMMS
ncbi:MAG: hypothetical protein CMR00_11895 [[Chlorobium] sp. 445]|nr:MAG: hypothetical protein CMR00_11895 [[Chlorobium] sp. 445]